MSYKMVNSALSLRAKALIDVLDSLPGRSYALIDAARSQGLMRWIDNCQLPIQSLYSGTSAITLREQAPYLVELDTANVMHIPIISPLLEHGWGQNLMLLIKSQEQFESLRIHLKKKLVVRNEHNQRLYFRFYDPRVARSFLAATAHEGLDLYFQGGILTYIIESFDAQAVAISRSSDASASGYDRHPYRIPAIAPHDEDAIPLSLHIPTTPVMAEAHV
jgi:hypothetical protein